jgi:lysophospholipase
MLATFLLSFLLLATPIFSTYIPQSATCPTTPLVRPANGLSDDEETYRISRKAVADESLKAWLTKTNFEFGVANLPTEALHLMRGMTDISNVEQVALTTSGGGYRSLLSGAGVIRGLDSRDSNVSTSGLFQALTYQAGLSGGSWLLSSLARNNYPTITYLKDSFWKHSFQDSLADPAFLLVAISYAEIVTDILGKEAAGYHTTLTDPWGRLLSYQLLPGAYGGVSTTLSSVAGLSSFTSYSVPFPITNALGTKSVAW